MSTKTESMNEGSQYASDRELLITRIINAPRELVYEVWTNPEHIAQWWGPNGFTNTILAMDVKPGGIFRLVMHGPDGKDYPNMLEYVDVVKNERLAWIHGTGEIDNEGQFTASVEFEDLGDKTKLTMRMLFTSAEELRKVVEEFGAIEGNTQTLNRLEAYLASHANAI